jgi:ABC-type transporter Mla subunit MlaD
MSNTSSKETKAETLASVQALIAGTNKHFPNGNINFGNATYAASALVQLLQSLADAINATNAAELTAKDALAAEQTATAKVGPVVAGYKRFLHATFANATQPLGDFGLEPYKARTPMTVQKKAAAAAKAKATREARGTTSKKQKLAVKGNVTGIIVTPVTSTPDAAPSAQPAPAPPPAPAPAGSTTK